MVVFLVPVVCVLFAVVFGVVFVLNKLAASASKSSSSSSSSSLGCLPMATVVDDAAGSGVAGVVGVVVGVVDVCCVRGAVLKCGDRPPIGEALNSFEWMIGPSAFGGLLVCCCCCCCCCCFEKIPPNKVSNPLGFFGAVSVCE